MDIKLLRVGPLQTNCYVVYDDKACVVFDPGYSGKAIAEQLDGRKLDMIVLTHGHMDHIGGLPDLIAETGAPVTCLAREVERVKNPERGIMDSAYEGYQPVSAVDNPALDGDKLEAGNFCFEIIHTPGHTEGSMCIYEENAGVLFSGDTLFCGTCGRTDFKGGSLADMKASLKKLMRLPDDVNVLPGHNNPTTIGSERGWIEG